MAQIMAGVLLVLVLICGGLFYQVRSLSADNATMKSANESMTAAVAGWEKMYTDESKRASALDKLILDRDTEIQKHARERMDFLKTIEGLQNENESVRAYLDGDVPDDLQRLLRSRGSIGPDH